MADLLVSAITWAVLILLPVVFVYGCIATMTDLGRRDTDRRSFFTGEPLPPIPPRSKWWHL